MEFCWTVWTLFLLILTANAFTNSEQQPQIKQQEAIRQIEDTTYIDDTYKSDLCETLFCRKGEECVMRGQLAVCTCRRTCPRNGHFVCASDLRTYPSHCEVHRQACLSNKKLRVISLGPCEASLIPTTQNFDSDFFEKQNRSEKITKLIQMPNTGTLNLGPEISDGLKLAEVRPPKLVKFADTVNYAKVVKKGRTLPKSYLNSVSSTTSQRPTFLQVVTPERIPYFTAAGRKCDKTDYNFLQNNLLLYFHAKYAEIGKTDGIERGKRYLVGLMFKTFDKNSDQFLTTEELERVEQQSVAFQNLLPYGCNLTYMVTYTDLDSDKKVSKNEFFRAYGFSVALLPVQNFVRKHTVRYGEQYQILCNIKVPHGQRVTWYRYQRPLMHIAQNSFQVSKSGASIYLTPSSLVHNGNFTCQYRSLHFPPVNQTHMVTVVKIPTVQVSPNFLLLKTGEVARLHCKFEGPHGMDTATVSWEKNGKKISTYNSTVFEFKNVQLEDTGSYACVVSSFLGTGRHSSSVVVREKYFQPEKSLREGEKIEESFVVLYKGGIRSFNADTCTLERVVPSSYMAPSLNKPSLCENYECEWSDAVVVGHFIYAALTNEMTIVIIDLKHGAVKQILPLDFYPKRLFYIPWKDTVWLETWHDNSGLGRTILVVHSASEDVGHGLTHALPLVSSFDSGPSVNSNPILYGYVTHTKEEKLHKLDLHKLSVVSIHDFSSYKCHPENLAFLTNVGLVVVYCKDYRTGQPSGQLLLDYMTDVVLWRREDVHGVPVVTPDGQGLLSIDQETGRIFMQKLHGKELVLTKTIDELFPLVDWTVFPSSHGVYGFDLFALSSKVDSLIKVNLESGQVEHLAAIGQGKHLENLGRPFVHRHYISTKSYVNSEFLSVVSSSNNVSIVQLSAAENVHCDVQNLPQISSVVWL